MQQYMLNNDNFNQDLVLFNEDDLHHIFKVMRNKTNDLVEVVNIDTQTKYVVKLNDDQKTGIIAYQIHENSELEHDLILAYGLVKADKLEFVIQKATELGVTKFIPLIMERSIVKYEEKKIDKKMQRWQKISKEASEQAHRNALMSIEKPIKVQDLINYDADVKLVPYEKATLEQRIRSFDLKNKSVLLVIGPEGGISESEITWFKEHDYQVVTLGKRILRTETAVIAALSIISDLME